MPRRKVQFVQGAYYHLYNRGAGRQSIFKSDDDYLRRLGRLKRISRDCNIATCLLPNHDHWLVRQGGPDPARLLPQRVFVSYTRTLNRIHQRYGTLFEANSGIFCGCTARSAMNGRSWRATPLSRGVAF